jgi:hypothetical protein
MPSDNNITLTIDEPVIFTPHNPITWGQVKYNNIADLYSFFKDNGLKVQVEIEQAQKDSTKH